MRNFYAIYNTHPGLVGEDGLPTGTVYIFSSQKERDAWVNDMQTEDYRVNCRRESIPSKLARRLMIGYVAGNGLSPYDTIEWSLMSTPELVGNYLSAIGQETDSVDLRKL